MSSRVSSRPMGWSSTGIGKMVELIAYSKNGGNMLKLLRYQKEAKQVPMAAGAECARKGNKKLQKSSNRSKMKLQFST